MKHSRRLVVAVVGLLVVAAIGCGAPTAPERPCRWTMHLTINPGDTLPDVHVSRSKLRLVCEQPE